MFALILLAPEQEPDDHGVTPWSAWIEIFCADFFAQKGRCCYRSCRLCGQGSAFSALSGEKEETDLYKIAFFG